MIRKRTLQDQRARDWKRQRDCWRILGLGYITSTHQLGDRCRKCGFGLKRRAA